MHGVSACAFGPLATALFTRVLKLTLQAMLWADSEDYYKPNAGLLAYVPSVPAELLQPAGGMTAAAHVALMRHQLRELRAALALAFALGRILILPPLTCGFDKYWAPLSASGVIPGAYRWAAPIHNCPLDHMLNPAELKPDPTRFVREHSFLVNPRTPSVYREKAAQVRLDVHGGTAERSRLDSLSSARLVNVTNLPAVAAQLWSQGQRLRQMRALAKSASALGGDWTSEQNGVDAASVIAAVEWQGFKRQFSRLQGGWCCAPHGQKPHAAGFKIME